MLVDLEIFREGIHAAQRAIQLLHGIQVFVLGAAPQLRHKFLTFGTHLVAQLIQIVVGAENRAGQGGGNGRICAVFRGGILRSEDAIQIGKNMFLAAGGGGAQCFQTG